MTATHLYPGDIDVATHAFADSAMIRNVSRGAMMAALRAIGHTLDEDAPSEAGLYRGKGAALLLVEDDPTADPRIERTTLRRRLLVAENGETVGRGSDAAHRVEHLAALAPWEFLG